MNQTGGWFGKSKMKNWQAAIRTWTKSNFNEKNRKPDCTELRDANGTGKDYLKGAPPSLILIPSQGGKK